MLSLALLVTTLPFFGRAPAPTNAPLVPGAAPVEMPSNAVSSHEPLAATWGGGSAEPYSSFAGYDPDPVFTPSQILAAETPYDSRTTIKGGVYSSEEDAFDDGFIVNLSWMTFFSRHFAMELEIGYLDADGTGSGVDTELWSIPGMVNARLNLPVWFLDLYGGVGVGSLYYDIEVSGGEEDEGFLLGANGFLGATVNLAEAIAVGIEGKYYVTEQTEFDEGLDAFAVMLTLGFSR